MTYQIVTPKYDWLYGICKNDLLNDAKDKVKHGQVVLANHYEPMDPAPWGALDAYREYWDDGFSNRYVVCYETCIVTLNPNWELTEDQMAVIGQKLGK